MIKQKKVRVIILVGLSGSGKSSIGKALAKQHNMPFIDTDAAIEKRAQQSIPEIFKVGGESLFRSHELQYILQLKPIEPTIIAVGGGALTQNKVLNHLKEIGTLIYLEADVENLHKRLESAVSVRPLLKAQSAPEIKLLLSEQLKRREANYLKADCTVNANQTSEKVIEEINNFLKGL